MIKVDIVNKHMNGLYSRRKGPFLQQRQLSLNLHRHKYVFAVYSGLLDFYAE